MRNKIKDIFEKIHAEEEIKEKTANFLRAKINKNAKMHKHFRVKRFAVEFAYVVAFVSISVFSYNIIYFTPRTFIDIDVNPSIEIEINYFDKVIGVYAYNESGEDVLKTVKINNKDYREAIVILIEAMAKISYLSNAEFLSCTIQTENKDKENSMFYYLNESTRSLVRKYSSSMQIYVFPINERTKDDAYKHSMSPAKYLAILELQKVDSTATIESCKSRTINELKNLANTYRDN